MQCPTDGTTLVMSERSGIEIDYCPQCRGVWLDRGELDKIIERAAAEQRRAGQPARPAPAPPPPRGYAASGHCSHGYGTTAQAQGVLAQRAVRLTSRTTSYEVVAIATTSYDVCGRQACRPAAGSRAARSASLDLVEEVVGRRLGDPAAAGAAPRRRASVIVVLPQCVAHDLFGPGVLDPVDLDDHAPLAPSTRRGSSAAAAPCGATCGSARGCLRRRHSRANVELTEGPHATEQIEQHCVRGTAGACHGGPAASRAERPPAAARPCWTAMVSTSAACRSVRAQRAARTAATAGRLARNAGPDDVVRRPPSSLPDVETACPVEPGRRAAPTPGSGRSSKCCKPSRLERRGAVEERTRAGLEHRRPVAEPAG